MTVRCSSAWSGVGSGSLLVPFLSRRRLRGSRAGVPGSWSELAEETRREEMAQGSRNPGKRLLFTPSEPRAWGLQEERC